MSILGTPFLILQYQYISRLIALALKYTVIISYCTWLTIKCSSFNSYIHWTSENNHFIKHINQGYPKFNIIISDDSMRMKQLCNTVFSIWSLSLIVKLYHHLPTHQSSGSKISGPDIAVIRQLYSKSCELPSNSDFKYWSPKNICSFLFLQFWKFCNLMK